jgi:hypothetical protein
VLQRNDRAADGHAAPVTSLVGTLVLGWHARDGNQAILDRLGLAGDFWRLS